MKTLLRKVSREISPHVIRAFFVAGLVCLALTGLGLTACNQPASPRTEAEVQTDQKLTDQVKGDFGNSPSFKFPDVEVASFKGTVQLSGFVAGADQKSAAEEIAKKVPGVVKVENRISLKN